MASARHDSPLLQLRTGATLLMAVLLALGGPASAEAQLATAGQATLALKHGSRLLNVLNTPSTAQENTRFAQQQTAAAFGDEAYLIVQFPSVLTPAAVARLAAKGIEREGFIPPRAYLLRVPLGTTAATLATEGAEGFLVPTPADKIPPPFLQTLQQHPNQPFQVHGRVTANITATAWADLLAEQHLPAAGHFDPARQYFSLDATGADLLALASVPFVTALEARSLVVEADVPTSDQPYNETGLGDTYVSLIRGNLLLAPATGAPLATGAGVVVGVGDNVYQGQSHVDLQGRHTVIDPQSSNNGSFNDHSVHTSGIVGGAGIRHPRFTGLAPGATLYSAVTGNIFDLGLAADPPMDISSNSWTNSDPNFDQVDGTGRYNVYSIDIDALLYDNPALLSLHSAGNFGHQYPGYPDNYLTLNAGYAAAKNTLVVGRYAAPTEFRLTPSYGPARDGRVKPDVVAANRAYATTVHNTYGEKQGSSQSTPAVAGVAALLYERYRQDHGGTTPDAALIKALLMNTSDYLLTPGPSYQAGYGRLNARRAYTALTEDQYTVVEVAHGSDLLQPIEVPAAVEGRTVAQLKVMLYWHDPAAAAYAQPALVNNLDLTVKQGGTTHLPWVLDTTAAQVDLPPTRGIDALNNIEQVAIDAPAPGTYTARIAGTSVPMGPQRAYLVYAFVLDEVVLTHPAGGEAWFSGEHRTVFWDTDAIGEASVVEAASYSLDGGSTWTSFRANTITPRASQVLIVPEAPLAEMLVRVTHDGETTPAAAVTISPPLMLTLSPATGDETRFTWNAIPQAEQYALLAWQATTGWQELTTTTDTTLTLAHSLFGSRTAWVSVQAVGSGGALRSQRSVAQHFVADNTAPVAVLDQVEKLESSSRFTIDVLANDQDADNDPLFLTSVTPGTQGTAEIWDDQTVMYRPNDGFAGVDTLSYTLTDLHGGTAAGTLYVMEPGGVGVAPETPYVFSLSQNYPNPFNPITTIPYELPIAGEATLRLYDVLGREVRVLATGFHMPGRHQVRVHGGGLASGLYFYRLTAAGHAQVRQLVLLK